MLRQQRQNGAAYAYHFPVQPSRTRGVTVGLVIILALGGFADSAAQSRSFVFAGLSSNTTMAELKERYPRSTFVDTLVYVSEQESHDSISTIALGYNGALHTLTITFERQRARRLTYPTCEQIVSVITNQYGAPTNVVDAQEEQTRNRQLQWKTAGESLTLHCFRLPKQPLYAERITIVSAT